MVNDDHLECLRRHRPRQPHYFAHPSDGDGRLVAQWNLVVPDVILIQAWEEPL